MKWQHAVAAVLFVALSVAITWPLAVNLERSVRDSSDPFITAWVLDWDWFITLREPLSLFHANAFYPARYSLAFSENLYGLAILLFPLRAAGVAPLTAHSLALIAGFAFCGFGAYLLGRHLTGSFLAGMAAGIFYAFVPFRFVHLAHLQHTWGGWLPLMLFALLLYAGKPSRRHAAFFALAFLMNGLTNIHYLLFGALASALTAAIAVPRRSWRDLAIATAIACLLLLPFLYPYVVAARMYGMQRSAGEAIYFSALPMNWIIDAKEPELRLFPGWLALIASAVTLLATVIVMLRRGIAASRDLWSRTTLGLFWLALGFLGSLGFNFVLHPFLFGGVPGFRAVRVPARWAVIGYIGMAILIALLTAMLVRRSRVVAALVPIAFAVELWAGPIRWLMVDPAPAPVYTWLATQPRTPLIELPMDVFTSDYEYLFRSTVHHQPIVNGVSGFVPPLRAELARKSEERPIPPAFVDILRRNGVELVVVHADLLDDARSANIRDWLRRELGAGRLSFVRRFDTELNSDWVFTLRPRHRAIPAELASFLAGEPPCSTTAMGWLDFPTFGSRWEKEATFSGWVIAPRGIRSVDLLLSNHRVRLPATVTETMVAPSRCAGRDVARARFTARFDSRPEGVRSETDVQVEITDATGAKTLLEDRPFYWEP